MLCLAGYFTEHLVEYKRPWQLTAWDACAAPSPCLEGHCSQPSCFSHRSVLGCDTTNAKMAAEKADIEHLETHEERRLSDTIADLKKSETLDTLHNDEAVKVLAGYGGDETWSAAEEKKVIKHIDRRLLPILIVTYGLQYYDKAMLSQAVCNRALSCPSLSRLSLLNNPSIQRAQASNQRALAKLCLSTSCSHRGEQGLVPSIFPTIHPAVQARSRTLASCACTNLLFPGHLWAPRRPGARNRQPLLLQRLHLLSWLYRWRNTRHNLGPTVPDRTRRLRDCGSVGYLSDVHSCMPQLARSLHPAILPWDVGERCQPYVHAHCRRFLQERRAGAADGSLVLCYW